MRFYNGVSYFIPRHRDLGIFRERKKIYASFLGFIVFHITFAIFVISPFLPLTLEMMLLIIESNYKSINSIDLVLMEMNAVINLHNTFFQRSQNVTFREKYKEHVFPTLVSR